jgi:hypothetical protein
VAATVSVGFIIITIDAPAAIIFPLQQKHVASIFPAIMEQ